MTTGEINAGGNRVGEATDAAGAINAMNATNTTKAAGATGAADAARATTSLGAAATASSRHASDDSLIVFDDVSKFYGEILGVNRVSLSIPHGITSLVGPNGSGKTTLMNLMTGLLRPTRGRVSVLGARPDQPERLFRLVGYCSQFDSFPRGATGREFISSYLSVHGYARNEVNDLTDAALERVGMNEAADRKVAGYSKGMRQRIRLAQSVAHNPRVLILDEPLNGLDPMARAEIIRLFRQLAGEGLFLVISSHILHEVDMLSDSVILLNNGYVVAEGDVHGVREEIEEHPMQILIRCDRPQFLAARLFEHESTVEARVHEDRHGLFVKTRRPDDFYFLLNRLVADSGLRVESVAPADDDLNAVYQYLISSDGGRVR
jgi:ABC-2 type transport system ATP-binding protein